MKAISLWQPWASAIAAGLKTMETRSWSTAYRGPLAIHAAKRWTKDEIYFWEEHVQARGKINERDAFGKIQIFSSEQLPLGCIVATCEIYGCVSTNDPPPENHLCPAGEGDWGNYSEGRYAWLLRDIKAITPIPCVGRQGFFDVEI